MEDRRHTLLIADGSADARGVLRRIFEHKGEVIEAASVGEALCAIESGRETMCAALIDEDLPGGGILELLRELNRRGIVRRLPVFLMTAAFNHSLMREAFRLGVTELLAKPVVPYVAIRRIEGVVELYKTRERLSGQVEAQKTDMLEQARRIIELGRGMVEALSAAIEFRSEESGEHVRRIRGLTELLLTYTSLGEGLDAETIEQIGLASVLHDVGKIAVPDAILNKPGKLTREEFEIMKTHTLQGEAILKSVPQLREHEIYVYACDIARHHHERGDGRGYPDGLTAGELTPWARAVSIADAYDALRMERVYKPAYSHAEACRMILSGQCGGFDAELLRAFESVADRIEAMYAK